ncbi:MAG TPA: RIP metalloprotease RseP [Stellaceae bacterium]|jgi:regulator of sigma E protease|nr:RIP metalloprotease RseP [Stellaceae bacterium]
MSFLTGGVGYILPFIIVLSVLVFVHELGHYLAARWNGVKVEVFSIGFGPELFGWFDRAGTRWKVSALPMGGYVRMFGDEDAASMPSGSVSRMTEEERAVSHPHKSVAARAVIAAAGPIANFLFAIIILTGLFSTVGEPFTPPDIGMVDPKSAAAAAGLKPGDVFVKVDGQTINRFEDVQEIVRLNTGTPLHMSIRRGNQDLSITAVPRVTAVTDRFGNTHSFGLLGVGRGASNYVRRNPIAAVGAATKEIWTITDGTLTAVWQMIIGARTTEELGGPLRIAKLSGEVAQGGFIDLLSFMALLSVNLGLINLFPIPILDGGHLLFYAAEALMGKPLGRRAQEFGFRLGLALVLTLMVFATWNDLVQLHVVAFIRGLVT